MSETDELLKVLDMAEEKAIASMKPLQVRDIVPVEKWLEDEYFVGRDGLRLYPFWKEVIKDVFDKKRGITELILEGALGTGKSTVGIYVLIRKMYEMSCYTNIPALYDLMSTANVVFMYFNISQTQASLGGFGQVRETMDSIPYFRENFPRDTSIQSILRMPEKILFIQGSSVSHQIGLNLIATILDEANFFAEGKVADVNALSAVTKLHTSVINRGISRFMKGGVNNSLSVLISSPSYSSSYTQQRIKQAETNPHTMVVKCRLWDVKPEGTYSKERFYVFIGSDKLEPFIVHSTKDMDAIAQSEGIDYTHGEDIKIEILRSPVRHLIDSVPIDFYKGYETNIIQSLQDISGISIAPQGRLFTSRVDLQNCVSEEIPELFYRTDIVIQTKDNSESNNITHYQKGDLVNPEKTRFVHIDQSVTTDTTGMAAAHKYGTVEREGQQMPVIALDFALRIVPPAPPKKISIPRCRSFIVTLNKDQGIPLGVVSYDMYASEESRQVLEEMGINSAYLSVDRNDVQYLEFINLILDGRLLMSQQTHDLIAEEIFDLIHFRARRKVDHPAGGMKDVMDACVGAVWNALYSEDTSVNTDDVKASVKHTSSREDDEQQRVLESILGDYMKEVRDGER